MQTVVEIDESVRRPKFPLQFFPSHHLPWSLQEYREDLKRLFLQLDPRAVAPQLTGSEVNLENSKLNRARPVVSGHRHTPHLASV